MACQATGAEAQCALSNPLVSSSDLLTGNAARATPPSRAGGLNAALPTGAGGGPAPRYAIALALFLNGSRFDVLLFGGANSTGGSAAAGFNTTGQVFGDTWQFDVGDHTWWNVTPYLGCSPTRCPSPRWGASMTYDFGDGYTLMFGGCGNGTQTFLANATCPGAGGLLSDTWSYQDTQGGVGAWTMIRTITHPTGRTQAGMAFDGSDQEVILFGGCAGGACPAGDTWAYRAGSWSRVYTPGPAFNPPKRYGAAMAQLGSSGGVVMFGGCQNGVVECDHGARVLGDTWLFYEGSWWEYFNVSNCSAHYPCPSPRYDASITTYASGGATGEALMFGGIGRNGTLFANSTDTGGGWWVFGGSPMHWSPVSAPPGWTSPGDGWNGPSVPGQPTGPFGAFDTPAPRYDAGLVGTPYGGILLFGGASPVGSPLGDTWAASPLNSPPADFPYSGAIDPETYPPPEYGAATAFDASSHTVVLFSGCGFSCGNGSTWSYAPYSRATRTQPWQVVLPTASAPPPPARFGASMVATTLDGGSVLLFGGWNSSDELLNDLWEFDHGDWLQLRPQGAVPPVRADTAMAFNSSSGEVVLFGGQGYAGPLGDTWVLQYLGALSDWVWTQVTPRVSPAARQGASFAYDAVGGKLVLFGGCGLQSCPLGDTWTFGGDRWTECSSLACRSHGPRPRQEAAFADDPAIGGLLLFGGCGTPCPSSDTWSFNATGAGVWTELSPAVHPPASYASTFSYDPAAGYPVLWGGIGSGANLLGGMGWAFVAGSWAPIPWSGPLSPTTSFLPEFGASLVYNPDGPYVLLVGGCSGTYRPGACTGGSDGLSTWEFAGGEWRPICGPNCGPPPRWDPILFFDASSQRIVLWGGCPVNAPNNGLCSAPLNDTWSFAGGSWTQLSLSSGPTGRADAAVASWFPYANTTIIFGGWNGSAVLDDAWNYSNGSWTQDNSSVPGYTGPPGSFGARMVYAPSIQRMLLYGGYAPGSGAQDLLWAIPPLPTLPPGAPAAGAPQLFWSLLASGPHAVFDAAASFDIGLNEMLVYGGIGADGLPGDALQVYHPGTDSWSMSILPAPSSPGPRSSSAMAYDPYAGPDGGDLLVGGLPGAPPAPGILGAVPEDSLGWGQGDSWWYAAAGWVDASAFT